VNENQSSYRQIFKSTSLFGGVQVINIIIGIIRVKFVAVLLGTTGVGIIKLLMAPLYLIISITGLGIATSAVREVSDAQNSGDQGRIAIVIKTLIRWSWLVGIIGVVVTISMAPILSQWAFGNQDYSWAFVWLSITILLEALRKGQIAKLQGMRYLKNLARAGVIGSALGLITSVPLYYIYGLRGIVPAIIITASTGLIISWYYARKIKTQPTKQSYRESYTAGLGMAKLGIYLSLAGFIESASVYILDIFISKWGGFGQVGLYSAGVGIVSVSTGMIFSAMSTDYYPRLSAVNMEIKKVNTLVRQQAETALFILTPLIALVTIVMPQIVRLLYTPEFLPVVMLANLMMVGMLLEVIIWSTWYIFLAKNDGRLYFIMELSLGILSLAFNLLGYYLYKLEGLAISFILVYLISLFFGYYILRRRYQFSLPNHFWRIFIIANLLILSAFGFSLVSDSLIRYLFGIIIVIASTAFSLYHLNKVMDLRSLITGILNRYKQK